MEGGEEEERVQYRTVYLYIISHVYSIESCMTIELQVSMNR